MIYLPFEEELEEIPDVPNLEKLAERVRRHCGQDRRRRLDLAPVCSVFGAIVRVAELGGREGGQEAVLVPLDEGRFGVVVDPTPRGGWDRIPPGVRLNLRRHRLRFRVGHELAHTFFYSRRSAGPPRRQLFDSDEQEDFCDRFSRTILVPRREIACMEPTAEGLVKLQRACDVSLEVAARAVAAARSDLNVSIWFEDRDRMLRRQWGGRARRVPDRFAADELAERVPGAVPLHDRRQWVAVSQS